MVEYALLVGATSLQAFAGQVDLLASRVNWQAVGYGVLVLVGTRIALWAFRSTEH